MARYYALELSPDGHEILFEFEATGDNTAQGVADMTVFTTMHETHHSYWMQNGRVIKVAEYERNGGWNDPSD